jgi:hypothetical protein
MGGGGGGIQRKRRNGDRTDRAKHHRNEAGP